jgi:uncharacterized membrane protein
MTRKYFLIQLLLIVAAVVAVAVAFPHLPNTIAMHHWKSHSQHDRYISKWKFFLKYPGPPVMAGTMLFTYLVPWLSPKQFSVDSFRSTYLQIMTLVLGLLAYAFAINLWMAFGHRVNGGRAIMGGCCLLIALTGNVAGKIRRNFFIGVRTPWTIASERVWNATHRFASKTFVAGGLLGLAFTIIGLHRWPLCALLVGGLAPVVYSLVFYKQLERRGEL